MGTLETLVRPWQTVDITPAATAPPPLPNTGSAGTPGDQPVVLTFGENGSGRSFGASYSFNETHYMDKRPKEKLGGGQVIDITFPQITFNNGQLQQ